MPGQGSGSGQGRPATVLVQRVAADMRATIQVLPPTGSGEHVTMEILQKALADKKVTYGIDETVLKRIVADRPYLQTITVAEGEPAENGTDAVLIYHFDKLVQRQDTSLDNLGQVDYKELGRIINTDADVLLLERIPPTPGKPGHLVTGKTVRQVRGNDFRVRKGVGVRATDDGLQWFSMTPGQVIYRGGQLSVESVLQINDVNAETGNIRFKGSVLVKGVVEDGFAVESSADIRVMGSVGAVTLKAAGDIAIVGGVFGKTQARIVSRQGSILAKFVQDADLIAGQDIVIGEYVRNSNLKAGNAIVVESDNSRHGSILGGSASANNEIRCNNLGGEMEIRTRIMVGVSREDLERVAALESAAEKRIEALENVRKSVFLVLRERQQGDLSDRKKELYDGLLATMIRAREAAQADARELAGLYRAGYVNTKCYLHVKNQIHPNVEINIQLAQLVVSKTIQYATLANHEGVVTIFPYREWSGDAGGTNQANKG